MNTLKLLFCIAIFLYTMRIQAQAVPYAQIPEAPENYTPGNILGRTMDGLGFRYYWATDGLRPEDLSYKASDDSRTATETLEHLYNLATMIAATAKGEAVKQPRPTPPADFEQLRKKTLLAIESASQAFKAKDQAGVDQVEIQFERGERTAKFPLWNLINGPIADAIYHTGQIVAFRRASGNPMPSGVNVFMGSRKEK